MSNVTSIRDRSSLSEIRTADDDLEDFIRQIRNGSIDCKRGVIVFETHSAHIRALGFGAPLQKLEAIGMMTWAADDIKKA